MVHAITWEREAFNFGASRSPLTRWLARRRQDAIDQARASGLARRFLAGVVGVGLAQDTVSCAGLSGVSTPRITHVTIGTDYDRLVVEMLPGQAIEHYREKAGLLAEAVGAACLRFRRITYGYLAVDVLYQDPLATQIKPVPGPELVLGLLDNGRRMTVSLDSTAHMIVQGQTRSGKSRFCYGVLVQLVERPDVLVCGSDVTGLLLRPFQGTRHEDLQALGSTNLQAHLEVLHRLVAIMDDRIAKIPEKDDVFPCSTADPYLFVVLEELPGLLRLAAHVDGKKNGPLHTGIRAAFGRLLAEGAKAGLRLLLISQRADADIIGGFERGQAPVRVSFSVDSKDAVRMLHPSAPDELAEAHLTALPSYALVSAPGIACARLRAPEMGSYGAFHSAIAEHRSEPEPDQ